MGQYRAASVVLEEGCKLDPLNGPMRLQLETATQGILRDLLEGGKLSCIAALVDHLSLHLFSSILWWRTLP
jgi:hypothetical protein